MTTLQRMVLSTALTILWSKRRSSTAFTKQGIITNEALNHMVLLLKLFQDKQKLNDESLKNVTKMLKEIKNQLAINVKGQNFQGVSNACNDNLSLFDNALSFSTTSQFPLNDSNKNFRIKFPNKKWYLP